MFDFTDVTIVTAIIMGLSEGAKRLGLNAKFIPILNLVLGIAGGCIYVNPSDIKAGVFSGIIIGLTASGLYSGVKNVVGGITGGTSTSEQAVTNQSEDTNNK
jgi:hypothetical protein